MYLPTYRKYEDSLDAKVPFDWNGKFKAAVKVDGTLNKREDLRTRAGRLRSPFRWPM